MPWPGADSTVNVPPSDSARERIAGSPKPPSDDGRTDPGSKPAPSSTTSRVTEASMKDSVISAREAAACRAVFASADCAIRSSATSYGVGSSTGVPLTENRTRGPAPGPYGPAPGP